MRRPRFLALPTAFCAAAALLTGASASPAAPADTQPPSVPQGMAFAGKTQTTVRLVWRASSDDTAVTGYRLYRNGSRVATVSTLGYTFTGLRCATRYTVRSRGGRRGGECVVQARGHGVDHDVGVRAHRRP